MLSVPMLMIVTLAVPIAAPPCRISVDLFYGNRRSVALITLLYLCICCESVVDIYPEPQMQAAIRKFVRWMMEKGHLRWYCYLSPETRVFRVLWMVEKGDPIYAIAHVP